MLQPQIQDRTRWWSREDLLLLAMLGFFFFLPGLGRIPLFDRDEPRFATAARTMIESGDYIVPHFNGELRPDKPPMVYWLMAAANEAFSSFAGLRDELAYRLPSAICGILCLIVVYFMAGSRFGRVTGLLAATMLGSSAIFAVESRLATADATMIFFIAVSMACAWQAWDAGTEPAGLVPKTDGLTDLHENGQHALDHLASPVARKMPLWMALLFWIALAAGILTKGVPIFFVLIPMLTLSLFTRRWKWWRQLRPLIGVPLLVVLVGWWVWLAAAATQGKLIEDMVGTHFVVRVAGPLLQKPGSADPMQAYGQPPGFFLLTVWGTFWPWSVLLIPAGYHAIRRLRGKTPIAIDRRPYQFLIAWIVPMWIFLELSRGKLMHYPLPTFLAIAILCADTLVQSWHRLTDVLAAPWLGAMRWILFVIWAGMGIGLLGYAHAKVEPDLFWVFVPFGGALIATGIVTAYAWGKRSWPFVTALAWGGSLALAGAITLPLFTPLQVGRLAGNYMADLRDTQSDIRFGAAGFEEPSLVFYAGDQVRMFGGVDNLIKTVFPASATSTATAPATDSTVTVPLEKYIFAVDDEAYKKIQESGCKIFDYRRFSGITPSGKPVAINIISNVMLRPAASATTRESAAATATQK